MRSYKHVSGFSSHIFKPELPTVTKLLFRFSLSYDTCLTKLMPHIFLQLTKFKSVLFLGGPDATTDSQNDLDQFVKVDSCVQEAATRWSFSWAEQAKVRGSDDRDFNQEL